MGQTASCEFGILATARQECIERRRSLIVRGKPVPSTASWSRLTNQEDDHGDPSASDALKAPTRALEQRQAYRSEATVAAKTCMVDPYPIADGGTDARLGNVQSGNRQQAAGAAMSSHFGSRRLHRAGMRSIAPQCGRRRPVGQSGLS